MLPYWTTEVSLRNRIYNLLEEKMLQSTINTNEIKYLAQFCTEEDIYVAFNRKVLAEKEIKLKEFNFKLDCYSCKQLCKRFYLLF